jgi:Na+-driven multidrug efflux pump
MLYSAVAGTGDTRAILAIQLLVTLCSLAVAYVAAIPLGLSLTFVWSAEALGWTVCLLLSWWWLRSGRWQAMQV